MTRTVDSRKAQARAGPLTPTSRPNSLAVRLKHAIDRLVAIGGLLVTAPIIAGVALALRLWGPGPVLRREQRVGYGSRPVVVRSFAITDEMCDSAIWRLLARAGVPALPQLWSVACGRMSIVGPRPREPGFEAPPARPGLTGLAQLAQLERWLSVAEQLELDERYARTWSLGLDARIIWRTLTSSGAGRARPRW
jgi:lipopolysaccharide/colanic/teichoic acid biosynthesis glycosyltransferase